MIYFVPEGIGNDFREYWEALPHSEEKMKIRAELAQKQGENHILLILKADGSLGPNYYGIRHFIPLFEGVQTIGLFLVEDTIPNFSFTIDKKMLMHYRKILFYQSHYSKDITLYFPQLPEDYSIYIGKRGLISFFAIGTLLVIMQNGFFYMPWKTICLISYYFLFTTME